MSADNTTPHLPATIFEVSFTSAMTDDDLTVLTGLLDLTMRLRTSVKGPDDSLALGSLDRDTGIFLRPGTAENEWRLIGQAWGSPADDQIHQWHVAAAVGAQRLDPTVVPPARSAPVVSDIPDRIVGRASQKAHGRIRRHMAGLTGADHVTPKHG